MIHDLDKAWEAVNALGGYAVEENPYEAGYMDAIKAALDRIEKLGGADPLTRKHTRSSDVACESCRGFGWVHETGKPDPRDCKGWSGTGGAPTIYDDAQTDPHHGGKIWNPKPST